MEKIFDEQYVECNDCGAYWNDQCDGLPLDRVKHCNSYYKATRNVDIPNKIIELENRVKADEIIFRICGSIIIIGMMVSCYV